MHIKQTFPICLLFLLLINSSTSFAWRNYGGYWDYHGSGRDIPYSYAIDTYYTPGYADFPGVEPDFTDDSPYIRNLTAPQILPPTTQITQLPAEPALEPNAFTINIPNNHGGYTAIVIKRSGNGFTGPQGEFYPEFPKVAQLKIIYGK